MLKYKGNHSTSTIFIAIVSMLNSCTCKMNNRKIKSITTFNFYGKVDVARAGEIYKTRIGITKVEVFDTSGNLVRENGFDKSMMENNIIEYKYDSRNRLIDKVTYQNYYNQPPTKNYLEKYIYKGDLLTEILYYFRTLDSSGFMGKTIFTYNQANQKVKEEYKAVDEDKSGAMIFNWKGKFNYTKDVLNKKGEIGERHFVVLNKQGKEIEHNMNVELSSPEDVSFPISFKYTFDQYGNELTCVKTIGDKRGQKSEYEYVYEGTNWNYRVYKVNGSLMWTQFRKIAYY